MNRTDTDTDFAIHPAYVEDYAVGPAILVRIDSRLGASGYVHTYAPVSDTPCGYDATARFEDVWGEVVTLTECRRVKDAHNAAA